MVANLDIGDLVERCLTHFKNVVINIPFDDFEVASPQITSHINGHSPEQGQEILKKGEGTTVFIVPIPSSISSSTNNVFARGRDTFGYRTNAPRSILDKQGIPVDLIVVVTQKLFFDHNQNPASDLPERSAASQFIHDTLQEWLGFKVFVFYQVDVYSKGPFNFHYYPHEGPVPKGIISNWKQALEKSSQQSKLRDRLAPLTWGFMAAEAIAMQAPQSFESLVEQILMDISSRAKTLQDLEEEGVRDIVLIALKASLPQSSQVSDESISKKGKTDLMVRESENKIYIFEFKNWGGKAKLKKAQIQLLGYCQGSEEFISIVSINRNVQDLKKIREQFGRYVGDLEGIVKGSENLIEAEKFRPKIATSLTEVRGFKRPQVFFMIDLKRI